MATMNIRMFDARRRPLNDVVDIDVRDLATMAMVRTKRDVSGQAPEPVTNLTPGRPYSVQIFPMRHRPVGHVAIVNDGPPTNVHAFCPIHPGRVGHPDFPKWTELPAELREVLTASTLEADAAAGVSSHGRDIFDRLADQEKAGLLNLFSKMQRTTTDGRTMWSFVEKVYRIRGDRIFADVAIDFRDHVKSAVTSGAFAPADDSLHTPPPGLARAGSFKHQLFSAGVLQLTFFASQDQRLRFKLDADIDDAGGLGHVFQVLRNWITQGSTSPYDIHEILVYDQLLNPGYDLEP